MIFNIYHVFAPFVKLRLFYFFSLYDIREKTLFLILEHWGAKQKKTQETHEILAFKPLLQEIQLKNLTIREIF